MYHPIVLEVIAEKKWKIIASKSLSTIFVHRETIEEMTLEIPENYQVKSLTIENTEKINSCWPHRSEGSEKFIADMIKSNINVGIFHNNGDLAAWCLQHDSGSLQLLQTDENHLRRGLGTLAVKSICKRIVAEKISDVQANVVIGNKKSLELFTKSGFRVIGENFGITVVASE